MSENWDNCHNIGLAQLLQSIVPNIDLTFIMLAKQPLIVYNLNKNVEFLKLVGQQQQCLIIVKLGEWLQCSSSASIRTFRRKKAVKTIFFFFLGGGGSSILKKVISFDCFYSKMTFFLGITQMFWENTWGWQKSFWWRIPPCTHLLPQLFHCNLRMSVKTSYI